MLPAQPTPTKAKSRLSTPKEPVSVQQNISPHSPSPIRSAKSHIITTQFFTKRLAFIPLLVLSLLSYTALVFILNQVHPSSIANMLFFHSYLPLQIAFFIANFFALNFLLLHTRRALICSCALSVILFLKLQSVSIHFVVALIPLLFFLTLEAFFSFIFRK